MKEHQINLTYDEVVEVFMAVHLQQKAYAIQAIVNEPLSSAWEKLYRLKMTEMFQDQQRHRFTCEILKNKEFIQNVLSKTNEEVKENVNRSNEDRQ